MQYAVCPECDNPIQIIGLYRLPANVKAPYGRHLCHNADGVAQDDAPSREDCGYFKPQLRKKTDRKPRLDKRGRKILACLIEEFDHVITVFQQVTGISPGPKLLERMLDTYRRERGYLYMGATMLNVPWIFAYMTDSQSLVFQHIKHNPELVEAVEAHVPDAEIRDGRIRPKKGTFIELDMCFVGHERHRSDDRSGASEVMSMIVTHGVGDASREIYRKDIVFDHAVFRDLMEGPDHAGHLRHELVTLARKKLGDLLRS